MTPTFAERVGRSARRSDGQLTIEVSETGLRDIAYDRDEVTAQM